MVTIITGGINSGKTTKLVEMYNKAEPGTGDGIISTKMYQSGIIVGYEIKRLSKDEKKALILLKSLYEDAPLEYYQYGKYMFLVEGFRFGERILCEALENEGIKDIYIDEIGPMELEGKGFSSVFQKVLESGKNVIACVRNSCLKGIIDKFDIETYTLIDADH